MSKFEIKVTPSVFIDSGEIHLKVQTEANKIYTEVMKTKDKATRSALIALGWTPPREGSYTISITSVYGGYEGWFYKDNEDNYLAYSYGDTYSDVQSDLMEELLVLEKISLTVEEI